MVGLSLQPDSPVECRCRKNHATRAAEVPVVVE